MVRSNRIQKLFIVVMAAILLLSQAGLFGIQTVSAASLENAVTVSAVKEDGTKVLNPVAIEITDGDTAFDVLKEADNQLEWDSYDFGEMITAIGGVKADSTKEFWAFIINEQFQDSGASSTEVFNGDDIQFIITPFDDYSEGEENPDEEDNKTIVNYKDSLISITDFIEANQSQMDWYGFSAMKTAEANITNAYADNLVGKVTDSDYSGSATDYARDTIILTSAGYDATDINGINLIEKMMNSKMSASNQAIYSLIALNSGGYSVPEEAEWTRDSLIEKILELEIPDVGGWSYFGSKPSPDITGMALVALAPYDEQAEVKTVIDRAIQVMSTQQGEKGGYDEKFNGGYSAESAAMMIVGLSTVGVDATSEAFTKTEGNLLEHLLEYQMEDGSFKHLIEDSNSSVFAINQAALALIAYDKFKNDTGQVFSFVSAESPEEDQEKPEENPEEDPKEDPTENPEEDLDKDGKEDDGEKNEEDLNGKKDEDSDNPPQVKVTLEHLKEFENKNSVVVKPESGKKESNFEVTIVQEVAAQLVKENKELVIDNEDAIVIIPTSVLKQLSESGEAFEVVLVEQEAEGALGTIYDFTIKVGNEIISEFDEGITLELAVDADKVKDIDSDRIKAFYYNDKTEEWEVILDSVYDPNTGFVTFTTTHFSTFGVFEYNGAGVPAGEEQEGEDSVVTTPTNESTTAQGQELPKTATSMFNLLMLGLALTLTGAAIFYIKNRKEKATE